MGAAVLEKEPLFSDDQLIPATQAAKKFGAMQTRAQKEPLFVTGKQGKPNTVMIGFSLYKKIYARLAELEEAEYDRVVYARMRELDENPTETVSWRSVRRTSE